MITALPLRSLRLCERNSWLPLSPRSPPPQSTESRKRITRLESQSFEFSPRPASVSLCLRVKPATAEPHHAPQPQPILRKNSSTQRASAESSPPLPPPAQRTQDSPPIPESPSESVSFNHDRRVTF